MSIPKSCDVVIIGGGPGGSTAATYLHQKGRHVVVLEKQTHPRYQVGESLIPHFWKYTDLAGVTDKILDAGFIIKAGGTVNWNGKIRSHSFKPFGYDRPALHVERGEFDKILLDHAKEVGAEVYERVAVSRVDFKHEKGANVLYKNLETGETGAISCHFVVDASGQSAVVGKQLGMREIDHGFEYMSIWGYFENAKYVAGDGKVYPQAMAKEVPPTTLISSLDDSGDAGWSWHITLRDRISVGLVIPREELKEARKKYDDWESYLKARVLEIPITGELLKDATLIDNKARIVRNYSYSSKTVAGPGYFLIGDAAGFVDPIFSLGILLGMYSAYVACWAIDRSLNDLSTTALNQEMYTRQFAGRVELARSLALPRYAAEKEDVSEFAREVIKMESQNSHDLIHLVSTLTTRSDNYFGLVGEENRKEIDKSKVRELDRIDVT